MNTRWMPSVTAVIVAGTMLVAAGGLGYVGWRWVSGVTVHHVDIDGLAYADRQQLLDLLDADTTTYMYDLDADILADRLQRHPWVRAAQVQRRPSGTLKVWLDERRPSLLVLDRNGRRSHYLDRDGYALPLVDDAPFDVPLLRGLREAYHPVRPVQSVAVRNLLAALPNVTEDEDALLSEFEVTRSGEIVLYTAPTRSGQAIPVTLGRRDFNRRFQTLRAFWRQAILTQPDKQFTRIDLRFERQIVTEEA